jgi:DNA-directed RNA polymerase I subunit RPA49
LDFVGREANDDADSQLKHYVAVVDPANQSWEFVEVRKVTLRGAVRKAAAAEEEVEDSEDEEMVCLHRSFLSLQWVTGRAWVANITFITEDYARAKDRSHIHIRN